LMGTVVRGRISLRRRTRRRKIALTCIKGATTPCKRRQKSEGKGLRKREGRSKEGPQDVFYRPGAAGDNNIASRRTVKDREGRKDRKGKGRTSTWRAGKGGPRRRSKGKKGKGGPGKKKRGRPGDVPLYGFPMPQSSPLNARSRQPKEQQ